MKIAELKDHLSQHLRAVERGTEVVVTDRSRPIARIVPIDDAGPTVRLVLPSRSFGEVRDRDRSPSAWRISSLDLLLEERRER